jgi:co-chaperonin GroES (HSP10)
MQFEIDDIKKVIPRNNYILVRANKEEKYLHLTDDLQIQIDTTFEPEKHSATYGDVVAVCEGLDDDLQTEMEVKVGDRVFFHYLCIMNCIRDKKYVVSGGVPYFMVSYGSMFVAKRKEEVVPINGYLLVEPISDGVEEMIDGIYVPESMQNRNHKNMGVVRYVGTPLIGEKVLAKRGDKIYFTKAANVPLQYELHNSFDGNKTYYRMKNDNVLAILN